MLFALAWLIADPLVPPTVTTTVAPKEGTVGDEIALRISVKHAEADAFEFPLEPALGDFDRIDRTSSQKQDGPMIHEEIVFKIATYDVGEHVVPAVTFQVGGAEFSSE